MDSYILYLYLHPKLSRYGTAIEDSLKASGRRVLPALQAGGRGLDSQEVAGAVDVTAMVAIEPGERGGGQPQADSAGDQGVEGGMGVVWDIRLFTRERRWRRCHDGWKPRGRSHRW
jgi:hypothetical protein